MKNTWPLIFLIVLAIIVGYTGWRVERWINWKLSYGNKVGYKVEQRFQGLEDRVKVLEEKW